jgi:hypothetical protein
MIGLSAANFLPPMKGRPISRKFCSVDIDWK